MPAVGDNSTLPPTAALPLPPQSSSPFSRGYARFHSCLPPLRCIPISPHGKRRLSRRPLHDHRSISPEPLPPALSLPETLSPTPCHRRYLIHPRPRRPPISSSPKTPRVTLTPNGHADNVVQNPSAMLSSATGSLGPCPRYNPSSKQYLPAAAPTGLPRC